MQKMLLAALGVAFLAPVAASAEVTGASIGFDYSTFAKSGDWNRHKATLGGSLEYAITPNFSIQGDIAQRYYGVASWQGTTGTAHAIYHMMDGTAVGGYYGHDWMKGKDVNYYGVEASKQIDRVTYEGYLGYIGNNSALSGMNIGLSGKYAVTEKFDLGASFAAVDNDQDFTRLGATAGYKFDQGFMVTGELGIEDQARQDKEAYIGIGLKATFGGNNGTTFGGRGIQDLWPGN